MESKLLKLMTIVEEKTLSNRFGGAFIMSIKLNYSECEDLKLYCKTLLNGEYKKYSKPIGKIKKVFSKYNIKLPN